MGKKTTKTTSTSTPWAPAQPLLLGAGNDIMNTVNGNAGNLSKLSQGLTGALPQIQNETIGSGTLQPGENYIGSVLGGQYLGQNNPYMNQMIAQTNRDVGNQVNAQFSEAGRTGGGANQLMLAQGLGNADNALRYQNYANERNNMTQAAGMLPGYQAAQNNGVQSLMGAYQTAGQLPYYGTQALSGIGSLYGGYGTQTGTQPGGWGHDLLNAAASAGSTALMMSDRRLKTNIKKVGELKDGLGIYTFAYKSDPSQTFRGVMADEVKALRPWAYVENYRDGYDGVNYAALGSVA